MDLGKALDKQHESASWPGQRTQMDGARGRQHGLSGGQAAWLRRCLQLASDLLQTAA